MDLQIYTDGGSLNNPGQAAVAYVIYFGDRIAHKFSARIGINSNNFAEYSALVAALEWVKNNTKLKNMSDNVCARVPVRLPNGGDKTHLILKIICHSDSSLMVNQVNGLFKIKNAAIRDFVIKIRTLEQEIKIPILYKYIPREENTLADSLVKKVLIPVSEPA